MHRECATREPGGCLEHVNMHKEKWKQREPRNITGAQGKGLSEVIRTREKSGRTQEKTQDTGNAAGHTLRLRWGWKKLVIFAWTRPI